MTKTFGTDGISGQIFFPFPFAFFPEAQEPDVSYVIRIKLCLPFGKLWSLVGAKVAEVGDHQRNWESRDTQAS